MINLNKEAQSKVAEAYRKMKEKLDPVGKADSDIDNDGDVDSSDEYLHKRRKAIKKSMKGESSCVGMKKKSYAEGLELFSEAELDKLVDLGVFESKQESEDAQNESYGKMKKEEDDKVECPKCEGKGCDHCDDTGYHKTEKEGAIYAPKHKMKESNLFSEEEIEAIDEKAEQTKGATAPEGIMDKESPKSKKFADMHKGKSKFQDMDTQGHDDALKAARGGTKQSASRRGDNLGNGDSKTAPVAKDSTKK